MRRDHSGKIDKTDVHLLGSNSQQVTGEHLLLRVGQDFLSRTTKSKGQPVVPQ